MRPHNSLSAIQCIPPVKTVFPRTRFRLLNICFENSCFGPPRHRMCFALPHVMARRTTTLVPFNSDPLKGSIRANTHFRVGGTTQPISRRLPVAKHQLVAVPGDSASLRPRPRGFRFAPRPGYPLDAPFGAPSFTPYALGCAVFTVDCRLTTVPDCGMLPASKMVKRICEDVSPDPSGYAACSIVTSPDGSGEPSSQFPCVTGCATGA